VLEHSRVFYFNINGEEKMWLSSADWMNRNMMRRVEAAWPIEDAIHRARVLHECCELSLQDNQDAWMLQNDGTYLQHYQMPKFDQNNEVNKTKFSAQKRLLQQYAN
jgi:polyphosphate kinase